MGAAASARVFRCDHSGETVGRQAQSVGRLLILRDDCRIFPAIRSHAIPLVPDMKESFDRLQQSLAIAACSAITQRCMEDGDRPITFLLRQARVPLATTPGTLASASATWRGSKPSATARRSSATGGDERFPSSRLWAVRPIPFPLCSLVRAQRKSRTARAPIATLARVSICTIPQRALSISGLVGHWMRPRRRKDVT